ncbi:unnamed protein product, partial [Darwinula stevensoni]
MVPYDELKIQILIETCSGNKWFQSRTRFTSGRNFINLCRLRTNSLMCRELYTRGKREELRLCRANCLKVESLSHIPQGCLSSTLWFRVTRHNRLLSMVSDEFTSLGYQVITEPRVMIHGELRKPDLLLIKNNSVTVCDLTVGWESPTTLNERHTAKACIFPTLSSNCSKQPWWNLLSLLHIRQRYWMGPKGPSPTMPNEVMLQGGKRTVLSDKPLNPQWTGGDGHSQPKACGTGVSQPLCRGRGDTVTGKVMVTVGSYTGPPKRNNFIMMNTGLASDWFGSDDDSCLNIGAPGPTGGTDLAANAPPTPSIPVVEGGTVVLGYPLKVPLSCSICSALLLGRAGLESHFTSHGVAAVEYFCMRCGRKDFPRYHSCACHYAKCNPKVIPKEPDLLYRCEVCRRQFATSRGLGQHERHQHPTVRNEKRQAGTTKAARLPRGYWSDVELLILWEMEESLSGDPRLNQLIAENLHQVGSWTMNLLTSFNRPVPSSSQYLNLRLLRTPPTGPGPEGLIIAKLKEFDVHSLSALLNIFLWVKDISVSPKISKTVLIPKAGDLSKASNWKPITISSALIRLLHKILAKRLSLSIQEKLSPTQRAFLPVDGTRVNTFLLDAIIDRARRCHREIHCVSLDIAKAFDSVSHFSIRRCLQRFGFNDTTQYIMSRYRANFLNKRNLTPKVEKCSSISLVPEKKTRKIKVLTEPTFSLNNQFIPNIYISQSFKYMGIYFNHHGKMTPNTSNFHILLERLFSTLLKPQQKIFVLRMFAIPRPLHQLSLGRYTSGLLKSLDCKIRGFVKGTLRLPTSTASAVLYARVRDGGLSIPLIKIADLDDPPAQAFASSTQSRMIRKRCGSPSSSWMQRRKWKLQLHFSINCHGLEENVKSPGNTWFSKGTKFTSGRTYINLCRLRTNLLICRELNSRGTLEGIRTCEVGCSRTESLSHQGCPATHWSRITRHNRFLDLVVDRLSSLGFSILYEPRITINGELRKPDLILVQDQNVTICDLTVGWETPTSLDDRHTQKVDYYGNQAIALSSRGGISPLSNTFLQSCGLTEK